MWILILGLKWVKLHLELNNPLHCFFAPRMGIKAFYFLDFFIDDIAFIADRRFNLKVMVRVRLTVKLR